MAFFVFVKMGKAPLSHALREIKQLLCVQSLILYYIKQKDSMLPCICPVIDHRGRQNVVRTSVTHSAIAWFATFLFLLHFDVICDLLLDRCTATWYLFVNLFSTCTCVNFSYLLFIFSHYRRPFLLISSSLLLVYFNKSYVP